MGEITIAPELMSFVNKQGKRQIYIRITQNKKHKRKKAKIAIKSTEWDVKEGRVKKNHPNYRQLNAKTALEVAKYEKQYDKLKEEGKKVTKTDVFQSINKVELKTDFLKYWDVETAKMKNWNNEKTFNGAKNKIIECHGEIPMDFSEITPDWLQSFDDWMQSQIDPDTGKPISITTRHIHFKKIRRIWNLAIKAKVVSKDIYPFGKDLFSLPSVANVEKELERLEIHEIQSMFKCQYENNTLKYYTHRGFLIAFLCAGIRIEDLLTLKQNSIKNGNLTYRMKKGVTLGKLKSFGIDPELQNLLDGLIDPEAKPTDYLLPFLPNGTIEDTSKEYKSLISEKTAIYNKNLKLIAKDIGTTKNVSSHVARHSWAAITYEATKDIKFIQDNLDHENIETTIKYIGRLTTKQNDEKLQSIYTTIFADKKTKLRKVA